jgi:CBS domain-containing membrane protein
MMTVDELMTRELVTLREDADLNRIDDLLKLHHIRHLPIVREGRLVGLVTHRDLLRAQARLQAGLRAGYGVTAGDVMTREVETITPDTSVRHAINRLLDDKFGCLPVVDGQGRLVGIFTDSDAARLAGRMLAERDNARAAESAGSHAH